MVTKETYNKKNLIKLIKKAQGELTQNEFSKKCNISSSNLTRIYKGEQRPSPDLLKKISNNATAFVPYEKLMIAAGYWKEPEHFELLPVKNIFNYRLKNLREKSGYTIEELANKAGVSVKQIQAFENDLPIDFCRHDLIKLANVLEVNTDYLTGESMYKTDEEQKLAFQTQDLLEENLEKLGNDFSKKFLFQVNHILTLLMLYENEDCAIKIPIYKDSFIKVLKKLRDIYDSNFSYTNLYNNYNFFHRDSKFSTQDYQLDDLKRLEVNASAYHMHNDSVLFTINTLNEISDIFKVLGESVIKEYYKDVYNDFLEKENDFDDEDDL